MVFTDVTDVLLGVTFRQCPTAVGFIKPQRGHHQVHKMATLIVVRIEAHLCPQT